MVLATSSRVNEQPLEIAAFARHLQRCVRERPAPLLVLRLPQFERIAWRQGKRAAQRVERSASRAFVRCARRCLRAQDLLAHEPHSDVFIAAIVARPRTEDVAMPSAADCRSALERISAGMCSATDLSIETGWTLVRKVEPESDLSIEVALALERGLRERERYEFFATVGHELRTPLTSIRGYLETVLDGEIDPQTSRHFLETARREALRLGRLVDNMFEFSLLDLSYEALSATSCDAVATARAACEVLAPLAAAKRINLQIKGQTMCNVGIDHDACLQALINLVDNAIKYGHDGGRVEVCMEVQTPFVRIMVDDNGPGIAPADRERIFDLRVRLTSTRPGTGIGLGIVRMIAERAGGEVQVDASPLGGARFTLLLPYRAEFTQVAS